MKTIRSESRNCYRQAVCAYCYLQAFLMSFERPREPRGVTRVVLVVGTKMAK